MANKNKKGKIVKFQPIPLKKYILEAARKLPIKGCYTFGEGTLGLKQIFVVREKRNGNVIVGSYLVDTYCLGLKNTFFAEFEDFEEFEDKLLYRYGNDEVEEIDAIYAMNLIYGAIEFAEDAGFEPHKDFSITEFILDYVETLEFVDIEFGQNGTYAFIQGPDDKPAKIIATLDKNIGKGNYLFVAGYEGLDFDDEIEDELDFPEKYFEEISDFQNMEPNEIEQIFIEKIRTLGESEKADLGLFHLISLALASFWEGENLQMLYIEDANKVLKKSREYLKSKVEPIFKGYTLSDLDIAICLENMIQFKSPYFVLLDDFIEAFEIFHRKDIINENQDLVFHFILPFKIKKENLLIALLKSVSKILFNEFNFKALPKGELTIAVEKLTEIIYLFLDTDELKDRSEPLLQHLINFQEIIAYMPVFTEKELIKEIWEATKK